MTAAEGATSHGSFLTDQMLHVTLVEARSASLPSGLLFLCVVS
jgi:hypothetical protein